MNNRLLAALLLIGIFVGLENLYPFFTGRRNRLRHAAPNISLAIINGVITQIIFAGLIVIAVNWSGNNSLGLLRIIRAPLFIKGIAALLIFDLWMYIWHRANHEIPFLWIFHRVHHTDTEMDTTTAFRFHPIEILFSSFLRIGVIIIAGMNYSQLLIYELFLRPVILFHHSNIRFPEKWDSALRYFIVTPNMHRVHHSKKWPETDSNYSSIFSLWDRIFGTFREREDIPAIDYGLKEFREEKWHRLGGALALPFQGWKLRGEQK